MEVEDPVVLPARPCSYSGMLCAGRVGLVEMSCSPNALRQVMGASCCSEIDKVQRVSCKVCFTTA